MWLPQKNIEPLNTFSDTYGPADATATPLSLALLKYRMVQPFWCQLTQVVLEKWSLNGCLSDT